MFYLPDLFLLFYPGLTQCFCTPLGVGGVTHQGRGNCSVRTSRTLQDDWRTSHSGLVTFCSFLDIRLATCSQGEPVLWEFKYYINSSFYTSGQTSFFYWKHSLVPGERWGRGEERRSLKGKGTCRKLLFCLIARFMTLFHCLWSLCISRLRKYFSKNNLTLICAKKLPLSCHSTIHLAQISEGPDPWPSDSSELHFVHNTSSLHSQTKDLCRTLVATDLLQLWEEAS